MSEIVTVPGEQAKWQQLHAIAIAISQAKARGDLAGVQRMRGYFATKAAEIKALTQSDLPMLDQVLLALDDYISASVAALPRAISALPNAVIDGFSQIAQRAGVATLGAALPWGLLAVGVIALVLYAEKTRTSRRFV